jgi:hypothetical protein
MPYTLALELDTGYRWRMANMLSTGSMVGYTFLP